MRKRHGIPPPGPSGSRRELHETSYRDYGLQSAYVLLFQRRPTRQNLTSKRIEDGHHKTELISSPRGNLLVVTSKVRKGKTK